MKRAIDGGERVTEKQLAGSLHEAFATGLFTFSEIAFDKRHQHAVLAYSFVCGGLCGHGNTIVLRKVGGKWKPRKTCQSWISSIVPSPANALASTKLAGFTSDLRAIARYATLLSFCSVHLHKKS